MINPDRTCEPHLTGKTVILPAGGEWKSTGSKWSVIQVLSGKGYLLTRQLNRELEPGTVLLLSELPARLIRASQLGELSWWQFTVQPQRLMGLITLQEWDFLDAAATRENLSAQVLAADTPIAAKIKRLHATMNNTGPFSRLQLLEVFFELFGNDLLQVAIEPEVISNARDRLRVFLGQTPASELLHLSFQELAQMTRCTPRHLSRIFQEVLGMSFRDKRADLRLSRARELLATTESKVVHVALESGYQSLSLFNLMFARRFGTSPAKWRRKYQQPRTKTPPTSRCQPVPGRVAQKKKTGTESPHPGPLPSDRRGRMC